MRTKEWSFGFNTEWRRRLFVDKQRRASIHGFEKNRNDEVWKFATVFISWFRTHTFPFGVKGIFRKVEETVWSSNVCVKWEFSFSMGENSVLYLTGDRYVLKTGLNFIWSTIKVKINILLVRYTKSCLDVMWPCLLRFVKRCYDIIKAPSGVAMDSMDTAWYLSSDTTFAPDNMTFSNATAAADGFTITEGSTLLAGLVDLTTANSSAGNGTHTSECDTDKPILIIITQVNHCNQSYQHVYWKISLLDIWRYWTDCKFYTDWQLCLIRKFRRH
jgi:hypothetical protein